MTASAEDKTFEWPVQVTEKGLMQLAQSHEIFHCQMEAPLELTVGLSFLRVGLGGNGGEALTSILQDATF